MRWRILGSDVSDGNSVLLDVEADNAVDAVSQAHDRKIVVGRVARSGGRRLLRLLPYALFASTIALSVYSGIIHTQLTQARQGAADNGQDARRILSDLENARDDANSLRQRVAFLESSLSQREKQRDAAIKELGGKLSATAEKLATAQESIQTLEQTGKQFQTTADDRLAAMNLLNQIVEQERKKNSELAAHAESEKKLRQKAERDLELAITRTADAEARAAGLHARMNEQARSSEAAIAELKNQLTQAKLETETPAPRAALSANYDAALDFVTLAIGKPLFEGSRGNLTVSAISAEKADAFVMHTDKQRIFDATLQVCLAEDTPREYLAENKAALAKFVSIFAPKWKAADEWLAQAFKNVAGKGENDRAVLLNDYYRISVWGNKAGQFSVLVEPRGANEK